MYIETIPSGFSPFCTLDEKRIVSQYITRNACYSNNGETTEKKIKLEKEPKPMQEHTFCHLCRVVYADYIEHLETKTHKENLKKNQPIYDGINNTFKRIRDFWKDKKFTETNEIEEEKDTVEYISKGNVRPIKINDLTQSTTFQTGNGIIIENINKAFIKKIAEGFKKKRKSNEINIPSRANISACDTKFVHNYNKRK